MITIRVRTSDGKLESFAGSHGNYRVEEGGHLRIESHEPETMGSTLFAAGAWLSVDLIERKTDEYAEDAAEAKDPSAPVPAPPTKARTKAPATTEPEPPPPAPTTKRRRSPTPPAAAEAPKPRRRAAKA